MRRSGRSRTSRRRRAIVETLAAGARRAEPLAAALGAGLLALPPLQDLAAPLPVGPVPPPVAAAAAGGGARTISVTFAEGSIVINVPGGDAVEIAGAVTDEMADSMRRLVEQVDSQVTE